MSQVLRQCGLSFVGRSQHECDSIEVHCTVVPERSFSCFVHPSAKDHSKYDSMGMGIQFLNCKKSYLTSCNNFAQDLTSGVAIYILYLISLLSLLHYM